MRPLPRPRSRLLCGPLVAFGAGIAAFAAAASASFAADGAPGGSTGAPTTAVPRVAAVPAASVTPAATSASAKPKAARASKRPSAAEKDARAFLDVAVPLIIPATTVDGDVAWTAATDVTPEHTGARAGADRTLAAVSGARVVIERCKALLAHEKELDELTARQLR